MALAVQISGGALLAGMLIAAFRRPSMKHTSRFWARALFAAAGVYVGFALAGGAPPRWILVEVGGLALFAALAILGFKYSPWVLAGAWLAHIAWDMWLHPQSTGFVPLWYPRACIGFDLVASVYIVARYVALRTGRPATVLSQCRH